MSFADLPNVRVQNQGESIEEYARHLANLLALYRDTLDYVINGHINFNNIQANGINTKNLKAGAVVAEKIDVNQLSAISANLGHITAGLIEAITMVSSVITGSLIQTKTAGNYPRSELSAVDSMFKAETDANRNIRMYPVSSGPLLIFGGPLTQVTLDLVGTVYTILNPVGRINLTANGGVYINNIDVLGALAGKANAFSGFTGGISYTDGGGNPRSMIFNNGIFAGTT